MEFKLTTVEAVVAEAVTFNNPAEPVKAPEPWIETIPFVATAPAVAEITRSNEPEVIPADGSVMLSAIPVVCAPPRIDMMVPETVEAPATCTKPSVEAVVVNAPVAIKEIAPFVAIAPAVDEVARISEPVVRPVVETTERPTPEVIAPAVRVAKPVPV